MSTALQAGDILQVRAVNQLGGQIGLNVWHYFVSAVGASPATDQDFATDLHSVINTLMKTLIPNEVTWKGILVNIINRTPLPIGVQDTFSGGTGLVGVQPFAKQAAPITSWYTASAGPKFRGRTYWSFVTSQYSDPGAELSVAGRTAINNVCAALFTYATTSVAGRTATHQLSIYHRATKTATPITAYLTRLVVATQKRRGDYGRQNFPPL